MMFEQPTIYVAGHCGMVGSAIVRALRRQGQTNFIVRTRSELDLTNQAAVNAFFELEKPGQVYLAAAKVGGIHANDAYPAEFIYENLLIQANIIHAAHCYGVQKLLFLGSSCIYPKFASQPMNEDTLLTGTLEPTNEPYAIAKIAGIKLCESYNRQFCRDYRSVMPTNLYGPGDNYHLTNSHVLPAMIRKFHLAKLASARDIEGVLADEARYGVIPQDVSDMIGYNVIDRTLSPKDSVVLWGSGSPYREFLHVDDMAAACLFIMNLDKADYDAVSRPMLSHINIGYGADFTIRQTAQMVAEVIGYNGGIKFDARKPDGSPRKLMDSTRLNKLGWAPKIEFKDGIRRAYMNYLGKDA